MARQPRIDLAGIPQPIIQRGNNRQTCFFTDDDRCHYLEWLRTAAEKYGGFVHAYVLMTNHVHLLATGTEVITPHATYVSIGRSDAERFLAYQGLFRNAIDNDDIAAIRSHVNQGKVLGSETFRNEVEVVLNRRVRLARPGRPRNVL